MTSTVLSMVRRATVAATMCAAMVGLAGSPAHARVFFGFGFPFYGPAYYPPPVYYPPPPAVYVPPPYYYYPPPPVVYSPPPAYYPPPYPTAAPTFAPPPPATQQQCRPYNSTVVIDGTPQQTTGTACLQPNGTWRITR